MSHDTDEPEVYRCGSCERIFDRLRVAIPAGGQYETPRCPLCGTKIDHEDTEVGTVAF